MLSWPDFGGLRRPSVVILEQARLRPARSEPSGENTFLKVRGFLSRSRLFSPGSPASPFDRAVQPAWFLPAGSSQQGRWKARFVQPQERSRADGTFTATKTASLAMLRTPRHQIIPNDHGREERSDFWPRPVTKHRRVRQEKRRPMVKQVQSIDPFVPPVLCPPDRRS